MSAGICFRQYQYGLRVLHTFVLSKSFGQLLDISPEKFIYLKKFSLEFSFVQIWFTEQNYKPLQIED